MVPLSPIPSFGVPECLRCELLGSRNVLQVSCGAHHRPNSSPKIPIKTGTSVTFAGPSNPTTRPSFRLYGRSFEECNLSTKICIRARPGVGAKRWTVNKNLVATPFHPHARCISVGSEKRSFKIETKKDKISEMVKAMCARCSRL